MNTLISKLFLGKYYFIKDIEIDCSNSDKEYSDEECINLILETLKKLESFLAGGFKVLSWNIKSFLNFGLRKYFNLGL